MKVLIFGSEGFMGRHFLSIYPHAETPDTDIADSAAVSHALDEAQPDIVINCAGKTGRPNIDWCEEHKRETVWSNVTGPLVLLEECGKRGIHWVHLSTGCIYEGDNAGKGHSETDHQNFFGSFYSRTKGYIDQIFRDFPLLQLRLRMPFDGSRHPRNLIEKLTKYPRINTLPNSLTCVRDFLKAAQTLIAKRATGTYNVVNPGAISPYRIMELYREIVDPSHRFEPFTPVKDLSARSGGRSDCILCTDKLRREGIVLKSVEEAVREALMTYKGAEKQLAAAL